MSILWLFLDIKNYIWSTGKTYLFLRDSGKKVLFLFKSHGKYILLDGKSGKRFSSYHSEACIILLIVDE